jgi:hypothetical protein
LSVFGSDDTPEWETVSFVDVAETFLVNVGHGQLRCCNITVETQRGVGRWVRESTAGWRWLREDGNWVAEVAGRAVGVGTRQEGGSSGKLHMLWRLRRIVVGWWGYRLHGTILVDGRRHGVVHDGRVRNSSNTGGDRSTTLAAVATMRQLVVVETAGQLSLFQVSGNVFVWHLLEAGLEEINFL